MIYLFWLSESFQIPFEDVDWSYSFLVVYRCGKACVPCIIHVDCSGLSMIVIKNVIIIIIENSPVQAGLHALRAI